MSQTPDGCSAKVYAPPRQVGSLDDCLFYHTMDIPGHGSVTGQWDLRGRVRDYLGGVDLRGKRVLEMGTASGFLCFEMEKLGADVVGYDLSEEYDWDIVPFAGCQAVWEAQRAERKRHIRRLNNGWWFAHRAFRSKARVVYGSVYEVPAAVGPVDVATFGCILVHLRDPLLALQSALRLTRETVIVTEPYSPPRPASSTRRLAQSFRRLFRRGRRPQAGEQLDGLQFLPDFRSGSPLDSWWQLSPQLITRFLGVFGFTDTAVSYHRANTSSGAQDLVTVIGHRTQGQVVGAAA